MIPLIDRPRHLLTALLTVVAACSGSSTSSPDAARPDVDGPLPLGDNGLRERPAADRGLCPAPSTPDPQGNWTVDGKTGDDCNAGTAAAPLRTIQRCASVVAAGQTCVVRAGTYRETVAPAASGKAGAPITFRPAAGEVVVISGADAVPASLWTKESASVWVATLGLASAQRRYEAQVFVGGAMWVEARWRNLADATHLLDHAGEATAAAGSSASSSGGSVAAAGLPPGCSAAALKDATIRVRGGWNWFAHTGRVSGVSGSTISYVETANVEKLPVQAYASMSAFVGPKPGSRFYLTGAACLLDAAKEWHADAAQGKLRLWWPGGTPGDTVEVKRRDWAFDLRGRSHVTVEGLRVFAAGITTGDTSTGVVLRKLDVRHASHFVKIENPWGSGHVDTGVVLRGSGNTIRDSVIDWSAGNGVALLGQSSTVHNNSIQHVDYAAIYAAPVTTHPYGGDGTGNGNTITSNTLRYAGRDGISIADGCPDGGAGWVRWQNGRIAFNEISHYGMLNQDLGGIYLSCQDGYGTHIDHNRIHDTDCTGDRGFTGSGSSAALYFDFASKNFAVHHNVVWNAAGGCIAMNGTKGDNLKVGCAGLTFNNNTCGAGNGSSVSVLNMGSMAGTFFTNNIFLEPTRDENGNVLCYQAAGPQGAASCPAYGAGGGYNLTSKPSPGFRDESSWCDYHLASGSPAVDGGTASWTDSTPVNNQIQGAPDFGAYETGGYDWTPGPLCAGTGYTPAP